MNWSNVFGITLGALVMIFALLRVERKRLWAVIVFLIAPTLYLLWQWVSFHGLWLEALPAFAIAGVVAGGWWWAYGRKLPPPTSDNIKVWGQENIPKPKPAEMQAELQRLRDDKARLEAELDRLKSGQNGKGE